MEQNPKETKKICYNKISPPIKLKQLSVMFVFNYINNLMDHAEIYMNLLVPKNI